MMPTDPSAVFGRFVDRQQRQEQFSEDMKRVINAGPGGGSSSCGPRLRTPGAAARTRSPGLAAGAALALGGGSTAAEVHAEAHLQRRQALEHARRRECPFDDHTSLGNKAGELGSRPSRPPAAAGDARVATEASKAMGRQNRDLHQRVGAGAPFDAPEREHATSSSIAASGAAVQPQAFSEAQAEMVRNKQRMQGAKDLLGGYLDGAGATLRRNGSLPPRPPAELHPEAQMRFHMKGGSVASLTHGKAAYLNSSVLADNCRLRNESVAMQLA